MLALLAIVLGIALVVMIAADRPSFLAANTTTYYFPRWLAGPLGGLWPWLTRDTSILKGGVTAAIVVMYASYVLALRHAASIPARVAIGAVVAVHLIVFLCPPFALTDVFNYINYGRMEVVHHLNPYATIPALEPHSDPSYALSNWHKLLSPYGPLFTLITFAIVPFGLAGSFWALKALLMAVSLGAVALVWKSAKLLGRDPVEAIVLVGLNPIVLIWGLAGDHNDSFMMVFIVLGFYLLLRARRAAEEAGGGVRAGRGTEAAGGTLDAEVANAMDAGQDGGVRAGRGTDAGGGARAGRAEAGGGARAGRFGAAGGGWYALAGAALIAAVAVKASAGVLLPVVLIATLRTDRRALVPLLAGMLLASVAVAAANLIAFGTHIPDLSTQGRLVMGTSIPNVLGLALGQGGETETMRVLLEGVLVACIAGCCVLAWRRRDAFAAAGWASVALLATLAWVLPWYVLWVLPFAALSGSRRLRTVTLLFGVYLIVTWVPVAGNLFNLIHFHPQKTTLGQLHQRYVRELLY